MLLTHPATDVKEQIEKFKSERLGTKRKDFVETVQAEAAKEGDVVAEAMPASDLMDMSDP